MRPNYKCTGSHVMFFNSTNVATESHNAIVNVVLSLLSALAMFELVSIQSWLMKKFMNALPSSPASYNYSLFDWFNHILITQKLKKERLYETMSIVSTFPSYYSICLLFIAILFSYIFSKEFWQINEVGWQAYNC